MGHKMKHISDLLRKIDRISRPADFCLNQRNADVLVTRTECGWILSCLDETGKQILTYITHVDPAVPGSDIPRSVLVSTDSQYVRAMISGMDIRDKIVCPYNRDGRCGWLLKLTDVQADSYIALIRVGLKTLFYDGDKNGEVVMRDCPDEHKITVAYYAGKRMCEIRDVLQTTLAKSKE